MIESKGLFQAIREKAFAEVSRTETGGKGYDGVLLRDVQYLNPFFELL
jgi:beta-lysine 5,6-aminomutase alpha subunit